MAEQNGNVPEVISPSDEDTDDLEEFLDFLFQNEAIQVMELDESSNSSTAQYTELISLTKNGGKVLPNKYFYYIHYIQLNND